MRKPSPITERRRARKEAKALCRAEQTRLRSWIPAERKRVAGVIAAMRAHGLQELANVKARTAELVKLERDELRKRIQKKRAAAKLGQCVDTTAGPVLRQYGPRKPRKAAGASGSSFAARMAAARAAKKRGAPKKARGPRRKR